MKFNQVNNNAGDVNNNWRQEMGKITIRPRNDFCLIRVVDVGKTEAGILIPEISIQGKEYHVVAIGSKVEGLKPGDKVMMTGKQGIDWSFLPNHKDLLIIRQDNVVLIFCPEIEVE